MLKNVFPNDVFIEECILMSHVLLLKFLMVGMKNTNRKNLRNYNKFIHALLDKNLAYPI